MRERIKRQQPLSGFFISKKSKIDDIMLDIDVTSNDEFIYKIPLMMILLLKKEKKDVVVSGNIGLSF